MKKEHLTVEMKILVLLNERVLVIWNLVQVSEALKK